MRPAASGVKRLSRNRLTSVVTMRKMTIMHKSTNPWVGRWLRSVRLKSDVPVEDVAKKLNLHPSNVLNRERGAGISADDLPDVLAAYGATLAQYVAQAKKNRSVLP